MIFKNKPYFVLYGNCIPVKGVVRATIVDLQNNKFFLVPIDLVELLDSCRHNRFDYVYKEYGDENISTINSYLKFLLDNDLGFFTDMPNQFPQISTDFKHAGLVSNALIDVSNDGLTHLDYFGVIRELESLGCVSVQIRAFRTIADERLRNLLGEFLNSAIRDVKLLIEFDKFDEDYIHSLIEDYPRLSEIIIHNSISSKKYSHLGTEVYYIQTNGLSANDCGVICPSNFAVNIRHFTESIHYNSCLNGKVAIDQIGNICNCPSQKTFYGNIASDSIAEVIGSTNFTEIWKINKGDIDVCSVCEFRHVCTDCRVFITDENDIKSKPAKCSYDPYTALWAPSEA